jgi:RNA polymerase sigma-70 factor (ECF subfamily)
MKVAINFLESRTPFQTEGVRSGPRLSRSTERPLSKQGAKSFDNPPLRDTICLAQQGDAAAFEAIYQRHAGRVYATCLRMLRDPAEAEDTLQEAFLQLFRKIQTFRGESAFSTWLHRLTVNMVFMRLRRKKPLCVPLDDVLESDDENSKPLHEIGGLTYT